MIETYLFNKCVLKVEKTYDDSDFFTFNRNIRTKKRKKTYLISVEAKSQ